MKYRIVLFSLIFLVNIVAAQNEVQQLFPCIDTTGTAVPGCIAISLGSGQYAEAVKDTSYCSGNDLVVKYIAANSFLNITEGDSIWQDTFLNACAGGGGGEWTDNGLSIYPTEKTDSVIIGDSVSYGFGLFEVYGKSYFDDDIRIKDYTTGTGTYFSDAGYATFRGFNTIFEFSTSSSFFNIEADSPGDAVSILLNDDDSGDDAQIDFNAVGERFVIYTDATDDRLKIGNGNKSTFNGGIEFIDDDLAADAGEIYLTGYENSDSLTDNSGYNPLMIDLVTGKVEPGTNANGGGADGNGIYDGSGTVPTNTIATLTNSIRFDRGDGDEYFDFDLSGSNPTITTRNNSNSNGYAYIETFYNSTQTAELQIGRFSAIRSAKGFFSVEDFNSNDPIELALKANAQDVTVNFDDQFSLISDLSLSEAQLYSNSLSSNVQEWDLTAGDIFFPQYNTDKVITSQTNKYVSMIDTTNGQMFLIHPDSIGGAGGGGGSADGNDFLTGHSVTGASGNNSRTLTSTVSNQPNVTANINVADADSSITNEIQTLSIDSTASNGTFRTFTVSLTDGGSVSFRDSIGSTGGGTGTDDQTISLDSTANTYSLSIESGNTVNWIKSSDDQTISTTGAAGNITIEDGNTLNLNVDDADASATNEGSLSVGAGTATTSIIQSNTSGSNQVFLKEGNNITLSESGDTITITSAGGGAGDGFIIPDSLVNITNGTTERITFHYTDEVGNRDSIFTTFTDDTGGGGGSDGNGIYDGDGTVPTNTNVTLTDNISFVDSLFIIDDTNKRIQTDDTLYFGNKWKMSASDDGRELVLQGLHSTPNFIIYDDVGDEYFDLGLAAGGLQLRGYRTSSIANRDDAIQQVAHFTSTGFMKRTSVEVLADSIAEYIPGGSDDQTISLDSTSNTYTLSIESGNDVTWTKSVTDGNGIYDGDGTTPSDVDVTLADSIVFLGNGGNGEPILRVRKTGSGSYFDIGTTGANDDATLSAIVPGITDGRIFLRQASTNNIYLGDIDANSGDVIIRSNGNDNLLVRSSGAIKMHDYGAGLNSGTLAYTLGVTSTGEVIETTSTGDPDQVFNVSTVGSDVRLGLSPYGSDQNMDFRGGTGIDVSIVSPGDVMEISFNNPIKDTIYISLTHTSWNDTINNAYSDDFFQVPPSMNGWRIKEASYRTFENADQDITVSYSILTSAGAETTNIIDILNGTKSITETFSFGNTLTTDDVIRVNCTDTATNTKGLTMTLMIAEP